MTLFLFFAVLWGAASLAAYEGTPFDSEPYERWDQAGYGHVILFNSLIDDQVTLFGEGEDRQADTCILESSFVLDPALVPSDATVERAYLIWMGAVDPAKFGDPTDNAVRLDFSRDDGYDLHEDVLAGDMPAMLDDTLDPFQFESIRFTTGTVTGCTGADPGTAESGEVAFFTYRTDITDLFEKIQLDNRGAAEPLSDGVAITGTYTVSGLDCTEDDRYKCSGMMVSNWAIVLIYRSGVVRGHDILLYRGFSFLRGETMVVPVSGLLFPQYPTVTVSTVTAEGDRMSANQTLPPEMIYVKGENATSVYIPSNTCNPYKNMAYEVFNSDSSVFAWDADKNEPTCVTGGVGGAFPGIDVDTFRLSTEDDVNLQEHFYFYSTAFDLTLSANQDAILANLVVVAADTQSANFDIPPEAIDWPYDREKHHCSCRNIDDPDDAWCEGQPMYFFIKVENWGNNFAQNVIVVDELDDALEYVPGSTEMTDRADEMLWVPIPDKQGEGNDAFPLSGEGYKVADIMEYCNKASWSCPDSRLIRFKVVPQWGLPKNVIIHNIATIKEEGSDESLWYHTNKNFPLNLRKGQCGASPLCPELSMEDCIGDIVDNDDDETVNDDDEGNDTDYYYGNEPDASYYDDASPDADMTEDPDEDTIPDTDTKKETGCGCSLIF